LVRIGGAGDAGSEVNTGTKIFPHLPASSAGRAMQGSSASTEAQAGINLLAARLTAADVIQQGG